MDLLLYGFSWAKFERLQNEVSYEATCMNNIQVVWKPRATRPELIPDLSKKDISGASQHRLYILFFNKFNNS